MKLTKFGQNQVKGGQISKLHLLKLWKIGYEELYGEEYPKNTNAQWYQLNYICVATLQNVHKMNLMDIKQFIFWIWNWKAPQIEYKIKMLQQILQYVKEFLNWRIKTAEIRAQIGTEELCKRYMIRSYSNLHYGKEKVLERRKNEQ